MLINVSPGEECRIAIVEDGQLEELYQERASSESHVGNIYKGRVVHIEPSIQAAFVDFGLERNGFLHITDLHPMYFGRSAKEESERIGKKTPHRERPPIQSCLRRGQEILVQVLKEGIGAKGPTVTSYLSIPGRFLVLMPFMERMGVSRKVDDDESRQQMRQVLDELNPPKNFGFIIRTAGIGRTKTDLKRDLAYLQRLWKTIEQRKTSTGGVGELYAESDLVIRTIRDVFSTDIQRIVVDNESAARRAKNFLAIASPRSAPNVVVYRDAVPLLHRYDIERQIENIHRRVVPLRSGGSLVIDSTEALVAIDVNSGKSRESRDAETTAFKINQEAADEVCRQLRLRDLGGVIVIDLIDMRSVKHRREIEQRFRLNLKRDRARTQVTTISHFGILEMTRQRMRASLKKSVYIDCPACQGTGHVKSAESVVLDVMRRLALAMHHSQVQRVELTISPDVAFQLLNLKRAQLVALEERHAKPVLVRVGGGSIDFVQLSVFDDQNRALDADCLKPTQAVATEETPVSAEQAAPDGPAPEPGDEQEAQETPSAGDEPAGETKPRRRKRRRGGRRSRKPAADAADQNQQNQQAPQMPAQALTESDPSTTPTAEQPEPVTPQAAQNEAFQETDAPPASGRSRRRRRRGGRRQGRAAKAGDQPDQPGETQELVVSPPVSGQTVRSTRPAKKSRTKTPAAVTRPPAGEKD